MVAFLDTNLLLYAVGEDPSERHKQECARAIINAGNFIISIQVLNEFVWQSSRPNRGPKLATPVAIELAKGWRHLAAQDLTGALFDEATTLALKHHFNWWDCLIVAAARAQGCDILYTEDMQDGRIIDGLHIVNPFRDL